MQHVLRPYATAGIALVGASIIAVTPVAAPPMVSTASVVRMVFRTILSRTMVRVSRWTHCGAFALLPAQNASGNWIKVVQRVPVRIALDPKELEKFPLRVGLSTDVTVDTHERGGQVLSRTPASRTFAKTDVYSADLASADAAADSIVQANLAKP